MDHQERIDELLERYLELLDTYTHIRTSLTSLHTGMYQDIAHANVSAERGMRYGQECYDKRMQASRRLAIKERADGTSDEGFKGLPWTCEAVDTAEEFNDNDETEPEKEDRTDKKTHRARDPLRWFGFVVPMSLRDAQAKASKSITDLVPKLAMMDAEMRGLEIEIRRARKRRAKAEADEAADRD
jgi:hypothetical protein